MACNSMREHSLLPPFVKSGLFPAPFPVPCTAEPITADDPFVRFWQAEHAAEDVLAVTSIRMRRSRDRESEMVAKGRLTIYHGIPGRFHACKDTKSLVDDQGNRIRITRAKYVSGDSPRVRGQWKTCEIIESKNYSETQTITTSVGAFDGERIFVVSVVWAPGVSPLTTRKFAVRSGVYSQRISKNGRVAVRIPPDSVITFGQSESAELRVKTINTSAFSVECFQNDSRGAANPALISPIVECRPDGMKFQPDKAAVITAPLVSYGLREVGANLELSGEVWVSEGDDGNCWSPLVDQFGKRVLPEIYETPDGQWEARFPTTHFSRFLVLFFNRIVDLLRIRALYRCCSAAVVVPYISEMMDMPDKNGQQECVVRLDLEVDGIRLADEKAGLKPLDTAGGGGCLSLPFGDLRFTFQSSQLEPCRGDAFEKRVAFPQGESKSVVFQCRRKGSTGSDMIPIDQPIGSVTITRWNRRAPSTEEIYLRKTLCEDEWAIFRDTVDTRQLSKKIRSLGMLGKFKSLCISRLSLKDLLDSDKEHDIMDQEDFVGAIARLFQSSVGGNPLQLKTAMIERLQREEINQLLDPSHSSGAMDGEEVVSQMTPSTPSTVSSHYMLTTQRGPLTSTCLESEVRKDIKNQIGKRRHQTSLSPCPSTNKRERMTDSPGPVKFPPILVERKGTPVKGSQGKETSFSRHFPLRKPLALNAKIPAASSVSTYKEWASGARSRALVGSNAQPQSSSRGLPFQSQLDGSSRHRSGKEKKKKKKKDQDQHTINIAAKDCENVAMAESQRIKPTIYCNHFEMHLHTK